MMVGLVIDKNTRQFTQVDFSFVDGKARNQDYTCIVGETLFIDVMPLENCALADLSFCAGKVITLTFDNADAVQAYRAKVIRKKLLEAEQKPKAIISNTPSATYLENIETKKVLRVNLGA